MLGDKNRSKDAKERNGDCQEDDNVAESRGLPHPVPDIRGQMGFGNVHATAMICHLFKAAPCCDSGLSMLWVT